MSKATIDDALREFSGLYELLDDAYWEASTIADKDLIYDIISIFIHELSELNKLSIQDHHYPYEIITEGIRRVRPKLELLQTKLDEVVIRTRTLMDIRELMDNTLIILEQQDLGFGDFK
ncbi:MAG: hypothetical protein CSA52_02730 [Gammaproteobacteria bacterium]|nr:MAG: hypothetical protein CSB48_04400 [Pseudomonadota bacterium]PIE38315.1 MAG: hypothetical protein CSA52_02730 [Gammaproteobacteria bacterium]